jgi:hypothetical protein
VDPWGFRDGSPNGYKTGDVIHMESFPGVNERNAHLIIKMMFVQRYHPIQDAWAKKRKRFQRNTAPATF